MKKFLMLTILICQFVWAKETLIVAIHSYDEFYPWTTEQRTGFRSVLEKVPALYPHYSVEYMDTKRRNVDAAYEQELLHYMREKYKGQSPALIYVTDDSALKFVMHNREKLFPSVPVIFSGINDEKILTSLDKKSYTGLLENKDALANIKLIETLFPEEKEVLFINDGSYSGTLIHDNIVGDVSAARTKMELRSINENNFDSVLNQLKMFKGKAVVLGTVGGFHTKEGHSVPVREAIHNIVDAGAFSVFTMQDTNIIDGVIGGNADRGVIQGVEAGKMAVQVLTHSDAPMPKTLISLHHWIFDREALEDSLIVLPDEIASQAIFLNEHKSFYQKHENLITTLLYGLGTFVILSSSLFAWYLQRSRKKIIQSKQELAVISKRLNNAQAITHIGNWEWNIKTGGLWWSDEIYRIFGLLPQEFTATYDAFLERIHPDDRKKVEDAVAFTLESHTDYRVEHRIFKMDGDQRYVLEEGQVELDDFGVPVKMTGTVHDITERTMIQRAKRESEENYRNLFDNASDGIIIHDMEGVILEVNQVIYKRLGYSKEEMIGQHLGFIDTPKAQKYIPEAIQLLQENGHAMFEGEHRKKDGTVMPVEIHANVIEYRQTSAVLSVVRDISERKISEQAIAEAEELYRTMFNLSPVGILLIDFNTGKAVEFNKNAHESLGYTAEEFAQLHISDYEAKETPEETEAHLEALRAGRQEVFETRHFTKSGEMCNIIVSTQLIQLHGTSYLFALFSDVTPLKKYEEELKILSIRLSLATKAASMGVWEWDLNTNMLTWDDQMYTLYGVARKGSEENYSVWQDAVDPKDIDSAVASLQGALRGENEYNTQFWITTPKKERRCIQAMGSIELDNEGKQIRMVGVNWDITEQKEYEAALEIAKKSAESANIAKSNFLANMSHEIRTPMNAILGLTQMIHSLDLSPQAKDYLMKIDKSSKLLLHIINDILDFSKIEANRLEITTTTFELSDVIEQISALFGPKADAKGLELTINIAPNTPARLIGDSLRLSQILNNLLSNAVKFTQNGGVEVSVLVQNCNEEKVALQFILKDTGIGIAAEDHYKLFDVFSQVDGTITRKFGGTGLGLSISKRLVELMGGTISFESEAGVGSCFKFTLDFGIVDAQTYSQAESPLTMGMDILVVDDQESAREVIKEMLTTWKCRVDESENGEDALEKIGKRLEEGKPYDLIIVDWSMPGLNGVETIEKIRDMEQEHEDGVNHIIMMVTAYSRGLVLNSTNERLVDAFLNKPVTYSSLYDSFGNLGLHTKIQPLSTTKSEDFIAITAPIRGSSVLLVEDNEINIQVEFDFLRQMGIEVTVVTDGLQAVQLLEKHRFDAVLMDYQMPIMDGIEATEVLRNRGDIIPIIAMTAAAMQGDKERCLKAGMNDYLSKPIDIMQMAHVLTQWISPREQNRELNPRISAPSLTGGLPDTIEGVNLHEGLKNSANNPQLYLHVLKQFTQQYAQGCKPLVEMLEQQQLKEAKRWVHTLKGTSATIGANGVHEQAVIVESELENANEVEILCTMLSALTEVLASLKEDNLASDMFDYTIVMAELQTISEKLVNNQLVESEHINRLKGVLGDYVKSRSWRMLEEALENFEYDRAQKLTDTLRHEIEENHEPFK